MEKANASFLLEKAFETPPSFCQSTALMNSIPAVITLIAPRSCAGSLQGEHRLGMAPYLILIIQAWNGAHSKVYLVGIDVDCPKSGKTFDSNCH